MAAGVPVIASDSGGIPEAIIHNESGVIVPLKENGENNLKEFKKAIINLSSDKEKRKMFSENSLKRAKKIFSEEETLEKTFAVFKQHDPS
jgi:starch synthase